MKRSKLKDALKGDRGKIFSMLNDLYTIIVQCVVKWANVVVEFLPGNQLVPQL